MRIACLLLTSIGALSSGCSFMIADCGKDLRSLKSREEVRAAFGKPEKCGVEDGKDFEEFRTRRKIHSDRQQGEAMLAGFTLGASEVVFLPLELCRLTTGTLFGQTIRFTYDPTGSVTGHIAGFQPQIPVTPIRLDTLEAIESPRQADSPPSESFGAATASPTSANPER